MRQKRSLAFLSGMWMNIDMKLEILAHHKEFSPALPLLFDTRDYEGVENILAEEILEDFEQACSENSQCTQWSAILFNRIGPLAIGSLYRLLLEWEKAHSSQLTVYVKSEETLEYILSHELSPEPLLANFVFGGRLLCACTGDISEIQADAVVNASNVRLKLGAGVSGVFAKKAGPRLQRAMDQAMPGNFQPGDVVMTHSFLPHSPLMLHAACADGEPETVHRALQNILRLCELHQIHTVAIPALGTGTGGLPLSEFARMAKSAVMGFFSSHPKAVFPGELKIVLYSRRSFEEFCSEVAEYLVSSVDGFHE
jgi:O-acetyl-ADP-ribose deacetylase (regulator of RNase III)